MKILIVGYSRSGTTLLRHLLRAHRHVKQVLHETMLLIMNRGVIGTPYLMWAHSGEPIKFSFNSDEESWGEKILYDYPCMDFGVTDALDYCLFWNESFLPDCRIINIIRYPYDVVASSAKKRNTTLERSLEIYKHWMPWMWQEIDSLPNCKTIKFEDLLLATDIALETVFDFCQLDCSRSARKEAVSRATADIKGGKLNQSAVFKHEEGYKLLQGKGLEPIAEKMEYSV